jgi:hypothetical protein
VTKLRRDGENTCENCFWFEGNRSGPFGYCRNPRNARVGSAGSEYNRSDILEPARVGANNVCDHHEKGEPVTIRTVFDLKGVPVQRPAPEGFAGYYGYDMKWERKP